MQVSLYLCINLYGVLTIGDIKKIRLKANFTALVWHLNKIYIHSEYRLHLIWA